MKQKTMTGRRNANKKSYPFAFADKSAKSRKVAGSELIIKFRHYGTGIRVKAFELI